MLLRFFKIIIFLFYTFYSQEEIESLREKMQAQTSLVVVGSADDALRVGKTKRQIESVTQTMVDNMIMVFQSQNNHLSKQPNCLIFFL